MSIFGGGGGGGGGGGSLQEHKQVLQEKHQELRLENYLYMMRQLT